MKYLRSVCLLLFGMYGAFPLAAQTLPATSDSLIAAPFPPTEQDSSANLFLQRRSDFVHSVLQNWLKSQSRQLTFTSHTRGTVSASYLPDSLKITQGIDHDNVGDRLRLEQTNGNSSFPITSLLTSAAGLFSKTKNQQKKVDFASLPLPSPLEIDVLNVVWRTGRSTGPEIYCQLDTTIRVTAEMLWDELHDMAHKGLVAEKLISPQNTLTIATPVGGFPVEMSTQNRRNRVYEYTPLVTAKEMFEFIEAHQFLAMNANATTDSTEAEIAHEKHNNLLIRLSQANFVNQ